MKKKTSNYTRTREYYKCHSLSHTQIVNELGIYIIIKKEKKGKESNNTSFYWVEINTLQLFRKTLAMRIYGSTHYKNRM